MISFFNKSSGGGGGGDGTTQNIFCQLAEPTVKKGIWLQAEREIEHITVDENIYIAGEWLDYSNFRDDAVSSFITASVGDYIYRFSSGRSVKYNTITNEYTVIADPPASGESNKPNHCCVTIGTDIFICGAFGGNKTIYKYDTLNNTYTQMPDAPRNLYGAGITAIGTDIYIGGSFYSSTYNRMDKYDTLTGNSTQLSNISKVDTYNSTITMLCAVGTDIYIYGNSNGVAKYNTLTDTFSSVAARPTTLYCPTAVGNLIYLFYSNSSNSYTYKYNTANNTYSLVNNTIPITTINGTSYSGHVYDDKIYIPISYQKNSTTYGNFIALSLTSKTYLNNTVVMLQGSNVYETELYSNTKNIVAPIYPFADAFFYSNQLETDIPTYYGDGTQWVKIKN